MIKNNPIVEKIETLRRELIDLTTRSSLDSLEVVRASVKLDNLLNEYEINKQKNSEH